MTKQVVLKYLRYLLTAVLIGALAYFCRPDQVWAAMQAASLGLLAAYGGFSVAASLLGAVALLVLFDFSRRHAWRLRFLADYLYVQGIAQFTPAQLGELALPYVAGRGRYAGAEITAALVIQRISALLIIVLLALVGAGQWVPPAYLWAASLLVSGTCGALLFLMLRQGSGRWGWFGLGARLEGFFAASRSMLVHRGRRLCWHVALMALRYGASVLGNAMLLAAFDIHVPLLDLAAITALAILTNLVPVTVGGIGLTEGVFAVALKSYGYATGLTITAVLAARVVNALLAAAWVALHHALPRDTHNAQELARSS